MHRRSRTAPGRLRPIGQAKLRGGPLRVGAAHDLLVKRGPVKLDAPSAGCVVVDSDEPPMGPPLHDADLDNTGNPGPDLHPSAKARLLMRVIETRERPAQVPPGLPLATFLFKAPATQRNQALATAPHASVSRHLAR